MLKIGESTEDARTQRALPPPPCASTFSNLTADVKKSVLPVFYELN